MTGQGFSGETGVKHRFEWTIDGASGLTRGLFSTACRTVYGWIWGVHDDQTGVMLHRGRSHTLIGAERAAKIIMGKTSRRALRTRKGLSWVGILESDRPHARSRSPHPGEILADELRAPWFSTPARLADELGIPEKTVRDLIATKIPVTEDLDHHLSAYFCMKPGTWLEMQRRHDSAVERAFDWTLQHHDRALARMLAQVNLDNLPDIECDSPQGKKLL